MAPFPQPPSTALAYHELRAGIRAGLPVAVGYLPIAIAFGAFASEAHLTPAEAVLMSALVFAGASQFMAITMMLQGTGGLQIVLATLFINLRHLVMSMAVHHAIPRSGRGWRALLSFGITDETFALLTLHEAREPVHHSHVFALGLVGIAYAGWVVGTALGSWGAQVIPAAMSAAMTMGLYAMFIRLLVPHVRRSWRAAFVAGTSMALNALLGRWLNPGWAIIAATVVGASAGLLVGGDA